MRGTSTFTLVTGKKRVQLTVRSCRLESVGAKRALLYSTDSGHVLLGATAGCDLKLDDPAVSRRHAEIRFDQGQWRIVDLDSRNGTYLDGRRIKEAWLDDGAQLRVGKTSLRFGCTDATVDVPAEDAVEGITGQSPPMRQLFGLIRKVAPSRLPVVVWGETGTGKERVARALHTLSPRRSKPFVVLDCAALAPDLAESELFGHEEGAFSGAVKDRAGAFESADGGTLFLDEVGELPQSLQPKLLRALEQREIRRVGSNEVREVDVRVVSATHRDLEKRVAEGEFRQDLFFRLAGMVLEVPALRDRTSDLPLLAAEALGPNKKLTAAAMQALQRHVWPGNVRELINVLAHASALAHGPHLDAADLPLQSNARLKREQLDVAEHLSYRASREQVLEDFNRVYVERLLERASGDLSKAAEQSGLHKKSVERMMRRYGVRRPSR